MKLSRYLVSVLSGSAIVVCSAGAAFADVDIAIEKVASATSVVEASSLVYTLTATNLGSDAADNIQILDYLPTGFTYEGSVASQGFYQPVGLPRWFVGTLPGGASATLEITVTARIGQGGTTPTNTASLYAMDQVDLDPSNDSASVAVDILFRPPAIPSMTMPAVLTLFALMLYFASANVRGRSRP